MKRKITTIIVLSLAVSACCEKEGSFFGTIIKNRVTQIASAAQLESVINQESSTLNANAAAITTDNTQTALVSSKLDTAKSTDLAPELQTKPIKTNEIAAQNDQKVSENITKKSVGQAVAKLNDIELGAQALDKTSIKNQSIETNIQETKVLTEAIDQSVEIIDLDQTIQTEIVSDHETNGTAQVITAAIDKEFSTEPTDERIEKVITKSPTLQQVENFSDQKVASINENTKLADNKAEKLSELISLLIEEDNTAIEEIIEQAKIESLTSSSQSESDRNARLLELLSKDIKKQADKTNSKVSQQSLYLLNQILSE